MTDATLTRAASREETRQKAGAHRTRGAGAGATDPAAEVSHRIERALLKALAAREGVPGRPEGHSPPKLAQAMQYAVFPGGARVRPRLAIAVAYACGDDRPAVTDAAAASVECLHCASLVHDDLPCFDDAAMRRGRPSVHAAYGEAMAVLVGDALIVASFQILADVAAEAGERLGGLLATAGNAAGMPGGLVAGQAWESEDTVDLSVYQRAKTGALFRAATGMGALAAGADPSPWIAVGDRLGEAYQVADDIHDALAKAPDLGKPVGQDAALGRPNAVLTLGMGGAVKRLEALVEEATAAVPACRGEAALKALIAAQSERFVPKGLVRQSA